MTFDDIERVLGSKAVGELQSAIQSALAAGAASGAPALGSAAVCELLTAMLAAVIITPPADARLRATATAARIIEIVNESLAEGAENRSRKGLS